MTDLIKEKEIFDGLVRKVGVLDIYWSEYVVLYVRDDNDYSVIDNSAPFFFETIQYIFAHYLLLEISKLLDSKTYGKGERQQERLCFGQIFCEEKLKPLKEASKNIKIWRNSILAHLDKNVALAPEGLPKIKNKEIGEIVSKMKILLTEFGKEKKIQFGFPIKSYVGTAQALLNLLIQRRG